MKKILLFIFSAGLSSHLVGQDIHYSQYWNSPFNISPALTGVFRGDTRYAANYRSQWASVPVDFLTFTGSIDHKFPVRGNRNGFFAGGFHFNYDQAGLSRLQMATVGLGGSYTHQLDGGIFGTVGVAGTVNQRGFDIVDLTFDRQYNATLGQYDPTLSNGENFPNFSRFFPSFSTGLNFRFQAEKTYVLVDELTKRSRLDVGAGLFHFTRPDQGFVPDAGSDKLYLRISPYLMGVIMLGQDVDLVANFSAQFQGPYREYIGMLGTRVYLSSKPGEQFSIQLGAGYRFHEIGDALIPGIEFSYNRWNAGFTYDINISEFNVATQRRGGPEFSLRYVVNKVPVLSTFKVCPLI